MLTKRANFEDGDFQENYSYLSTATPTPKDSEEEVTAIDTDHKEQENRDQLSTVTRTADDHPEEHTDDELELIENAFEYLIKKKYPPDCSKNQKRIVQRRDLRSKMEKYCTRTKEGVW